MIHQLQSGLLQIFVGSKARIKTEVHIPHINMLSIIIDLVIQSKNSSKGNNAKDAQSITCEVHFSVN